MRGWWGTSEHRVLSPQISEERGQDSGQNGCGQELKEEESAGSPIAHPSARCLTAPTLEVYSWRNMGKGQGSETLRRGLGECEPESNQ